MALGRKRAFKTLGKTKKGNLLERLEKREKRKYKDISERTKLKRKNPTQPNILNKKDIYRKYSELRKPARTVIKQTVTMLERFQREPALRNAEFVFLDRDALPYMYIAKELCAEYGFKKKQFKKIISTEKSEQQIDAKLRTTVNSSEYMSIESNSEEMTKIAGKIPLTPETEALKNWIIKNIDLSKPVVIVDSGYNGTSVKRTQFLINYINPKIKTYTSMFYSSNYSRKRLDYYLGDFKADSINISKIENIPKFQGKALELKNEKLVREKIIPTEILGGVHDPVGAELALIAVRNALFRYKKEKGIK